MTERGKKILIFGGGVGGVAAAVRLRCLGEDYEITIVQRRGEIVPSPGGLPYRFDPTVSDRDVMLSLSLDELRSTYRLAILTGLDAIRIDRASHQLVVRDLKTSAETALPYDRLILSPEAAPIRPHIPGIELPSVKTIRTPAEAGEIIEQLDRSEASAAPVAILGGGLVGLELAENLHGRDLPVALLEAAGQVLIGSDLEMVAPLHDELRRLGVDLRLGVSISQFVLQCGPDGKDRTRLVFHDGETLDARLVLVAAGVQPEVSLALDAGLGVGRTGAIKVNDRMQTSDPDIYAIGDAVQQEVHWPERMLISRPTQTGSAIRQARIAADHLHGFRHHAFESFGGSTVVKVFGMTVAGTGFSEKRLKRERIPFERVYVTMPNDDDYLPGADLLTLKILFSPANGKLLGAQAVGRFNVERRIDVLAAVLRFGGTVRQLSGIELCYAPPVGWPEDPVHRAGNLASDVLDGLLRQATVKEMKRSKTGRTILDVRTPEEFRRDAIAGAVSLPLDRLREDVDRLEKETEYLVYSEHDNRSCLACRILTQHGFTAKNFPGGLTVFRRLVPDEK